MKRDGQRQQKSCIQDVNPRNFPPGSLFRHDAGDHRLRPTL
jgi:hypothetical protein